MKRFEGKVAIVTGGAGGIGSATARRLAAEGASVVVADIAADAAEAVAAEIGTAAAGKAFDAADVESIEALVSFTVERFGRLAILHNNAGYRSEEHRSELQSLMRHTYAVFCLKKKKETT